VTAREAVLSRFRWVGGHADVWRLFSDGEVFGVVVSALAEPFRDATKIVGIEARGFILGAAVAFELGVGFAAIRKPGGLFPGPKSSQRTTRDYRGKEYELAVQREAISSQDRVVLVDDWAEAGAQALAAGGLVESCGATFEGVSIVVDQLSDDARARIGRVHALVRAEELGPS
jgi:adenine phosphoribosyltransferase